MEALARLTTTGCVLALAALLVAPLALAEEDEGETLLDGLGPLPPPAEDLLGPPLEDALEQVGSATSPDAWTPPPTEQAAAHEERGREERRSEPAREEDVPRDHAFSSLAPLSPVLAQQVVILKRLAPAALAVPVLDAPVPAAVVPAPGPAPAAGPAAPVSAAPAQDAPTPVAASAGLVALASVAAVASATAGSAGFDWERLRRFALGAMLYTRIAKDRLLDHGRRDALLAAARERPGSTLIDLAQRAGIPRNTATYHLNRLEREGFVASTRQGRGRLYFAVGGEARRAQADAFAALRHDKGRALALAVGEAPGVDQQALCAKLGLAPSLVHWHADRLLAAGVLRKAREGRRVRYHPGPAYGLVRTSGAHGGDGTLAC